MQRSQLTELHYIAPIENVPSILKLGILSHNRAQSVAHKSIAMSEVQTKRAARSIDGCPLHDFANVYFSARNPMMFVRRESHDELCVLLVSPDVLNLPGTIISDQNAASDYATFWVSPGGLTAIDEDKVFARYWTHPDNQAEEARHKSLKCAEVLVPDVIASEHIIGAYVSGATGYLELAKRAPGLNLLIQSDCFFQ